MVGASKIAIFWAILATMLFPLGASTDAALSSSTGAAVRAAPVLAVGSLTTNHLTDPLAIDTVPRLAWKLTSSERGVVQTAYQALVASSPDKLAQDSGDVWGATWFSRLVAGDNLGDAILAAHRAAALNLEHRGATGLANHLRGELSPT